MRHLPAIPLGKENPMEKPVKMRQFKKIEMAKPKETTGGCAPSSDPDAPPC
ncbi:hypothetical protein GMLC_16570 [Geomonas limicola]|uniref:Uncharacterized protein n=1 Tax=Geomonas limicola TaxID=2740186 RepID=A0A6V8N687_9BACT|nr:hypothetical protein GMLC_16570 [Geomonas limicola]